MPVFWLQTIILLLIQEDMVLTSVASWTLC